MDRREPGSVDRPAPCSTVQFDLNRTGFYQINQAPHSEGLPCRMDALAVGPERFLDLVRYVCSDQQNLAIAVRPLLTGHLDAHGVDHLLDLAQRLPAPGEGHVAVGCFDNAGR